MISFNNFLLLNPESADLVQELISATDSQRSAFSSFSSVWMGFNGWMECITEAANDAEMIAELAVHTRLNDAFNRFMTEHPDFFTIVQEFAAMWPVVNVRDACRKLGRDVFRRLPETVLKDQIANTGVKMQPVGWQPGSAPTWSQVLRTIYAIRCNLFHGSKSPRNFRDHQLVVSGDKVLRMFIERSGCLQWND
jgi:hypothetical protein